MFKIVLVLCFACALANGEEYNTRDAIDNMSQRIAEVLQLNKARLERFSAFHTLPLEIVKLNRDAVISYVSQNKDTLVSLANLDGNCLKSVKPLPNVEDTIRDFNKCLNKIESEVDLLLKYPKQLVADLELYYKNDFKTQAKTCVGDAHDTLEIMDCFSNVFTKINTHKRDFDHALEEAECNAKIKSKDSAGCSQNLLYNTFGQVEEASYLTSMCLVKRKECGECEHHCKTTVPHSKETILNTTLMNPSYYLPDRTCFMLTVDEKE